MLIKLRLRLEGPGLPAQPPSKSNPNTGFLGNTRSKQVSYAPASTTACLAPSGPVHNVSPVLLVQSSVSNLSIDEDIVNLCL